MLTISAGDIDRALTFNGLVETLRVAFRDGAVQPVRHHHAVERPVGATSMLLLMPAWTDFVGSGAKDGYIGVKIVTVSPDNNALGKPAVVGVYMLFDGITGEPKALMDGPRLTQWRTAAASALAADYLARPDASKLLLVGAGSQASFLARAHSAVRPITAVRIWNRSRPNAERLVAELAAEGMNVSLAGELDDELGWADIVSCATISKTPLVRGEFLKAGTHVDLVGGFTPEMREADDATITRSRVFVDTHAGAMKEAGDIVQPLASGVLGADDIIADLHQLARNEKAGRGNADEITLFKSVGAALEDLAAAVSVFEKADR